MNRSPLSRWRGFVKRRMPKTLFGRSLLIIILPVLIMQIAVTWVFFDAHWETVTARLSDSLAGDIAWAVDAYKASPKPETLQAVADQAEKSMQLSVVLMPGRTLPMHHRVSGFGALDSTLEKALSSRLDDPYWFDTRQYRAYIDVRVKVPGGLLRVIAPRDRAFASRAHIFILWMTGATLLLTAVSIGFIRNQVRAIERLAAAAEAFGRGVDVPNFKPYGAAEVRAAASAFIDMKERIQRHIEQRTLLLASVSHDLRTPLTRLKLELALAEPGARVDAMKRDLSEMEHMIDDYLAFARGEAGETPEPVDLCALAQVAAQSVAGRDIRVYAPGGDGLTLALRPNVIRRALTNLIANAAAHAKTVEVTVEPLSPGGAIVIVDDDGPGIPEQQREEAFKPFSRLDPARNQNRKGVGLGLSTARDAARSHGGDLTLGQSPLGGLRAAMRLP